MIETLHSHLPERLPFYHLGWVDKAAQQELSSLPEASIHGTQAWLYQVSGDLKGAFVLVFPDTADASAYSELGNLLFTHWANQVSRLKDLDIAISPPLPASLDRVREWIKATSPRVQEFIHTQNDGRISVLTLSHLEPQQMNQGVIPHV